MSNLSEFLAAEIASKAFFDNPPPELPDIASLRRELMSASYFVPSAPAHRCTEQYVGIGFEIFD